MHLNTPNWRKVAGPTAALVASLHRIGWQVKDHRRFVSDWAESFDLLLDPPVVVVKAAQRSVRRWRLNGIAETLPGLIPQQPDLEVLHDRSGTTPNGMITATLDFPEVVDALLKSKGSAGSKMLDSWDAKCRADLKSAITGGQWPQARLAATRQWTDTNLCNYVTMPPAHCCIEESAQRLARMAGGRTHHRLRRP